MSHESNIAVTVAASPITIGALALFFVVLAIAVVVIRKSRSSKKASNAWADAAADLRIDLVGDGSELGPVARGKVNDHVVTVAPVATSGSNRRLSTGYSVKFEAPEAPRYRLIKRTHSSTAPLVDTGHPKFDAVVEIETDQPAQLGKFLTPVRRAAILRLLTNWPTTEITNRTALIETPSVEGEAQALINTICHLVAAAETFDRPTRRVIVSSGDTAGAGSTVLASPATVSREENGDSDVLTVVRLDEQSVIRELFDAGLGDDEISERFQHQFKGRDVTWMGEIVRVGFVDDKGVQRIAALIGSADGQDPASGRVVVVTTVPPEPVLNQGDVTKFSGTLANLNVEQRLFHLA